MISLFLLDQENIRHAGGKNCALEIGNGSRNFQQTTDEWIEEKQSVSCSIDPPDPGLMERSNGVVDKSFATSTLSHINVGSGAHGTIFQTAKTRRSTSANMGISKVKRPS
jgi:hypothetical protein